MVMDSLLGHISPDMEPVGPKIDVLNDLAQISEALLKNSLQRFRSVTIPQSSAPEALPKKRAFPFSRIIRRSSIDSSRVSVDQYLEGFIAARSEAISHNGRLNTLSKSSLDFLTYNPNDFDSKFKALAEQLSPADQIHALQEWTELLPQLTKFHRNCAAYVSYVAKNKDPQAASK